MYVIGTTVYVPVITNASNTDTVPTLAVIVVVLVIIVVISVTVNIMSCPPLITNTTDVSSEIAVDGVAFIPKSQSHVSIVASIPIDTSAVILTGVFSH